MKTSTTESSGSWEGGRASGFVLLVDDDPMNLALLEGIIGSRFATVSAPDGEQAWALLQADPHKFSAVVLDRRMAGISGDEVLARIRDSEHFTQLPVIFQSALNSVDDIRHGLTLGADYYITKPYDTEQMLATISVAVRRYQIWQGAQEHLTETAEVLRSLQLMHAGEAKFRFRSLREARQLSSLLANVCPAPRRALTGLIELSYNAIEHGLANISYEEKSRLLESGRLQDEVQQRIEQKPGMFSSMSVSVLGQADAQSIQFEITDPGEGFEYDRYLEIDASRIFDSHGRGIAMSKATAFDDMCYNEKGNSVRCRVARIPV